ncbi:hypothetical protein CUMW_094260 [Citrus unshiu]|uniref:Uncharacterized protein n=1 Tax=Citrus unshiu TaxID=55188 RepID=A0A2H5P137_CITUN|nr:hypothetical protein CUMW_094260 [Citrus unshiu]
MAEKLVLFAMAMAMTMMVLISASAEVPTIFIFGDSTADVGTNNFLPHSKFRANFPHNGIDFPHARPTGRFSNGLNSADFLAKLLGHKRSPPPFLSLIKSSAGVKKHSFRGISFASGGSGLLDLTGQRMPTMMKFGAERVPTDDLHSNLTNVIPLTEQRKQFKAVHGHLMAALGKSEAKKFLSKSLVFISTASNDIFEYYHSGSTMPKETFMSTLGLAYEKHLKALLNLGARKFGIISVPPIGCCPSQRIYNSTGGCLEILNEYARAFHASIESLLCKLSSEHKDMKYSLGNTFEMTINVLNNPFLFNFTDVQTACCGAGRFNAQSICDPKANLCSNRNQNLFWDLFHPTQAASNLAAVTLYGGEPRFVSPINFAQLAAA